MHRAVIFDLDGTLYDKRFLPVRMLLRDLRHIWWMRAERLARRELMGRDFGNAESFFAAFFAAVRKHIPSAPSEKKISEWYTETYMPLMAERIRSGCKLYPWVRGRFAELREQGIRTAVFSDYGFVAEKLSALGFDASWADLITDAPSMGGLKPSGASFLRVAEKLGVMPSECLVVGDREDTDGAGARNAGMDFRLIRPRG